MNADAAQPRTITVSLETYENLDGLRREGESLTAALERMISALKASEVVVNGAARPRGPDNEVSR